MSEARQARSTAVGIDVVIALGNATAWGDNDELRYCLRALERHFLDLRNVWIVGARPSWLNDEAIHLAADDPYHHNKDANIIHKLALACRDPRLSETFVRCSDDELYVRDTCIDDMFGHYETNLRRLRRTHQKLWLMRLRRTAGYLESQHRRSLMFDCHAPVPMHKQRFLESVAKAPYTTGYGLCVDSLYFNMVEQAPRKPLGGQLMRLRDPLASAADFDAALNDHRYLNYNDHALNDALQSFLCERFARPSRFERC